MDTWMWIAVWTAVIVMVGVLVIRERRKGHSGLNFDADAPRGQADTEARMRRDGQGPNITPGAF